MSSASNLAALVGRILLASIFIYFGFTKIGGFAGTAGFIGSKGLPMPQVLAAATIVLEIGAGLALLLGYKARWAALALAAFTLLASVIFHAFWAVPQEQYMTQLLFFTKNMAIIGGMLMVVALGPGQWSLDRR